MWLREDLSSSAQAVAPEPCVPELYEVLLAELNGADKIDWSRALVDGATTKAPSGGEKTGPNPTDRRKLGSKVHVLVDATGIPLALQVTGANIHDVTQVIPLVDGVPKVRGKKGRPRQRPDRVQGDRGYDSESHRDQLRSRRIEPQLAKRRAEHGSGLGKTRWYVERTLAWFKRYGKIRIRTEGELRTTKRWSNWRPASSAIGTYAVILLRALEESRSVVSREGSSSGW